MLTIYRSEVSASLRRVPIWLVLSNGTSPATSESAGQPQICWFPRGTATVNTAATLSLVSSNAGLYYVELNASEVSALGVFSVQYGSAAAIAQTVFGKIVNYDSGDSMRLGQFALPNAAPAVAGGLPTFGTGAGQINLSSGSVGLQAVLHSQATVGGADNLTGRLYSAVTVRVDPQAYSGLTIDGVNRVNSSVTPANATYSAITVRVEPVLYSGMTIDGVNIVSTAGARSIASSWMSTNLGNAHLAQEALFALRNKVTVGGSVMTVFLPDDVTSSWTASVTTGTTTITGVAPTP